MPGTGRDEFTVDFNEVGEGADPFNDLVCSEGDRQHLRHSWDQPCATTLYRLDEDSIRRLQAFFPTGLFHGPSYGSDQPWAEDPVLYRDGRLMLGVISHESFGQLRLSARERDMLARMGMRTCSSRAEEPGNGISFGPVMIRILGHEFPCLAGGREDDWLRVNFRIESIPRRFVGYNSLDCTIGTLDAWRGRLEALAAGRADEALLCTIRNGLSVKMARSRGEATIRVVVDGRGMGGDLPGHLWHFTIETSDVETMIRQCEAVVREREAKPDVRPQTSIPGDPQRVIRANGRFLLAAG